MQVNEAFGLLGLAHDTPLDQVRRRYHSLIKELHPDVAGSDSDRAKMVIEAYQCIRESTERNRYFETARDHTRAGSGMAGATSPRTIFTLGRWATTAPDRRVRLHAVRRLAATGLQSAAVFLRQAILDGDREIASCAAEGFLACAGISAEQSVLDLYDQLSPSYKLIMLAAIEQSRRVMPRVLAWAAADPSRRVRDAASRIMHAGGKTA